MYSEYFKQKHQQGYHSKYTFPKKKEKHFQNNCALEKTYTLLSRVTQNDLYHPKREKVEQIFFRLTKIFNYLILVSWMSADLLANAPLMQIIS